jgi:short-subunit dehydrogenase
MPELSKAQFGPWVVVTGASSGIGQGFARQLAAQGFHVVLVARRLHLLEQLGEQLAAQYGVQWRALEADLSDPAAIQAIARATDGLDIGLLINNAGTGLPSRFLDLPLGDILSIHQLNTLSAMSLTHVFGARMARRGRGGIFLSSVMGAADGLPYMASMAASKAMNSSLGAGLRDELKSAGIQVCVMHITPTETPIVARLGFRNSRMPMEPISVEQCVTECLDALASGRAEVMPGFKFRVVNSLVPASVKRRVAGQTIKRNNAIA